MRGVLSQHDHTIVEEGEDVLVINTCTVKSPTEKKVLKRLRELEKEGTPVVVAGCLPAAQPEVIELFPSFSFIGTNSGDIASSVESAGRGGRYVNVSEPGDKSQVPTVRHNPVVEILPISEGCLGSCTYCITKQARGELTSFRQGSLVQRVEKAVTEGVREVWVTSQDTGAYGLDTGGSLADLLNKITEVGGDFRVRVGMMNPDHALAHLGELLDAFENEKIYRFLHLPLQSGCDRVLADMGRRYEVDDFLEVANAFRKKYDITLSTDVICGYPTESDEDFKETLKVLEKIEPDVLNVSRFWPRPHTKAAELKQLPGSKTKERSRKANKLFKKIGLKRNKKWVGWEGEALTSQRNDDSSYTARNSHYKPIILKGGENLLGKSINVKIEEATYYDLRGQIIPRARSSL